MGLLLLQLITVFGSNWFASKIFTGSRPTSALTTPAPPQTLPPELQPNIQILRPMPEPPASTSAPAQDNNWAWWLGALAVMFLLMLAWDSSVDDPKPTQKAPPIEGRPSTALDARASPQPEKSIELATARQAPSNPVVTTPTKPRPATAAVVQKSRPAAPVAVVDDGKSDATRRWEAERARHRGCHEDEVRRWNWRTSSHDCVSPANAVQ